MINILLAHNFYQVKGGEDSAFLFEKSLLERKNHVVKILIVSNKTIRRFHNLFIFFQSCWSINNLRTVLDGCVSQVAHFHNIFPLLSPSVYYGAHQGGAAVVQTLHNFRLLCPNALFLRENKPCEICKGKFFPLPGVLHRCYRHSLGASLTTALMLSIHKIFGTWRREVDVYIALTEFSKKKFIEGGLPAEKIIVKPNFIDPDPGVKEGLGGYALYVGRLSVEKGVDVLFNAWSLISSIPLSVVGDGPLMGEAEQIKTVDITLLGKLDHDNVIQQMKGARFLVMSSNCYENFPLTIAEAYACGLPVVASRLGAMAELVHDGETGLLFNPGDPADLACKVRELWNSPEKLAEMSRNARAEYETKYTAEKNYEQLMKIYQIAIDRNNARKNDRKQRWFFTFLQPHQN